MAHLVHCWCGKTYRCDIEHPVESNVAKIIEDEHPHNCPDQALHGPRPPLNLSFVWLPAERTGVSLKGGADLRKILTRYSLKEEENG